jgi:hypothetical protein
VIVISKWLTASSSLPASKVHQGYYYQQGRPICRK